MLTTISFACYGLNKNREAVTRFPVPRVLGVFVFAASLLLFSTGHLGGSLTHGSDYLVEFAPRFIQKMAGVYQADIPERNKVTSLDSADIFDDAVQPILHSKCTSCHNKDKRKGKLVLSSFEEMMVGGEDGPIIEPGSLNTSEMYRRITLPENHKEFMPEGKRPLTDDQLAIIEWWIEKDAPGNGLITSLQPNKKMTERFERFYGLDKFNTALLTAPPPDTAIVNKLIKAGFVIRQIAAKTNLLDANFSHAKSGQVETNIEVKTLEGVTEQLLWLKLSDSGISDADLESIGKLSNLRKLNLSKNNISDSGVRFLSGLSKLEYLNLYETNVSDSSVAMLMKLPQLKELYVWGTKVTEGFIAEVEDQKANLKIIHKTP